MSDLRFSDFDHLVTQLFSDLGMSAVGSTREGGEVDKWLRAMLHSLPLSSKAFVNSVTYYRSENAEGARISPASLAVQRVKIVGRDKSTLYLIHEPDKLDVMTQIITPKNSSVLTGYTEERRVLARPFEPDHTEVMANVYKLMMKPFGEAQC